MSKEIIAGHWSQNALPSDIESITKAFLCRRRNFFTSQRFPPDIENNLHALLLRALLSPDLQLTIARTEYEEPVFFAIGAPSGHPVAVHLAGVWPEWRGRGIFSSFAEGLMNNMAENEAVNVYSHPQMTIANRQLERLGFRTIRIEDRLQVFQAGGRFRSRLSELSRKKNRA